MSIDLGALVSDGRDAWDGNLTYTIVDSPTGKGGSERHRLDAHVYARRE